MVKLHINTKPKPFVFILMPFESEFSDIYEYGIKAACEKAGTYCERVDEQNFDESILQRIYNQIAKADVIIADMSNRNANVFYETGFAHGLNKQVILLTQNVDDIPFDLKHYTHIVYGGKIKVLQEKLEQRVRWCVENPQSSLSSVELDLQFFINKISLENNPEIEVIAVDYTYGKYISLIINIHNATPKVLDSDSFNIGVILSDKVTIDVRGDISKKTWLPDGKQMIHLQETDKLFPTSWHPYQLSFYIPHDKVEDVQANPVLEATLCLYTTLGPLNYPFNLKVKFPAKD